MIKRGFFYKGGVPRKKYEKGELPCGACNLSKHHQCRLRMDGDLCSCNCPRAADIRKQVEVETLAHQLRGQIPPSNEKILLKTFYVKYKIKSHSFSTRQMVRR